MNNLIKCTIILFTMLLASATAKSQEIGLENIEPKVLAQPPFKGVPATSSQKTVNITLKQISVKKNKITDESDWYISNDLSIQAYKLPNSNIYAPLQYHFQPLPEGIPLKYIDNLLTNAFYGDGYNIYLYGKNYSAGRFMLITDLENNKVKYFLDFENYFNCANYEELMSFPLKPVWAIVEDNVLYVSNAHKTYASTTNGINAFITAIDLRTLGIIWRSEPLVCNANNFEIIEDNIVCGYGFTAEPDFLYILNKNTGRKVKKIKVASGPDYIIRKQDKLHVRTYDRDYIFEINYGK